MTCKTHPDAPHGFVRGASHSEDRYVCECEFWEEPKMNERVHRLKLRAGINDNPAQEGLDLFAELIVQECAELTSRYQMGTTRLPDIIVSYNYSDKLEDVLKKHFGVEE